MSSGKYLVEIRDVHTNQKTEFILDVNDHTNPMTIWQRFLGALYGLALAAPPWRSADAVIIDVKENK